MCVKLWYVVVDVLAHVEWGRQWRPGRDPETLDTDYVWSHRKNLIYISTGQG